MLPCYDCYYAKHEVIHDNYATETLIAIWQERKSKI